MAFGEETLLDAPVTPAPVFAYRALRAVIWGEERTPERLSQNTYTTRAYDVSRNMDNKAPIEFSPGQKRKHTMLNQLSPTKSILRTPGAHTPRRAMLKDLNVKFKDLRKSVSPELAHKLPPQPQTSIVDIGKENVNDVRICKDVAADPTNTALPTKLSEMTLSTTKVTTAQAPTIPAQPTTFDAEAYMRSTEKEMKKLIKYGQKMREYAKRQDEENERLRQMLEEMRKENERLQRQLEMKRADRTTQNNDLLDRHHHSKDQSKAQSTRATSTKISKPEPSSSTQDKPLFDLLQPVTNPASQQQPTHNTSSMKRPQQTSLPVSTHATHPSKPSSPSPSKRPRLDDTTEQNYPLHPIPANAGSTRLAPDRLAAARARVRKKAELRKSSAELGESAGGGAEFERKKGMARERAGDGERESKVDASIVDWAGL